MSLSYWARQSWTEPSRLTKCWVWGKDYIPWHVGIVLIQPRIPVDCIWFMVSSWIPRAFLPSCFPAGCPQLVLVHGAVPLQVQDLARVLVKGSLAGSIPVQSLVFHPFPFPKLSFTLMVGMDPDCWYSADDVWSFSSCWVSVTIFFLFFFTDAHFCS